MKKIILFLLICYFYNTTESAQSLWHFIHKTHQAARHDQPDKFIQFLHLWHNATGKSFNLRDHAFNIANKEQAILCLAALKHIHQN